MTAPVNSIIYEKEIDFEELIVIHTANYLTNIGYIALYNSSDYSLIFDYSMDISELEAINGTTGKTNYKSIINRCSLFWKR